MPVNYTFVLCSGKTKWNEWSYLVEINYNFKVQYSTEYSTVRFNISYGSYNIFFQTETDLERCF